MDLRSFLFSALLTHFISLEPHQSVTSLVQVLLCFPLRLVPSIFPSISSFCFPFPRIKCPKYCSFVSYIVLRSVCFTLAISKTSKLDFLSRCDILNMRRKPTSQKHWFYPPTACLVSIILRHAKRWKVHSTLPNVFWSLNVISVRSTHLSSL